VEIVRMLYRSLNASFKSSMTISFAQVLFSSDCDLQKTEIASRSHTAKYMQAVYGLKALRECGVLNDVLQMKAIAPKQYMSGLLSNLESLSKSPDLVQIQLAGEVLLECMNSEDVRYDAFKLIFCPPKTLDEQGSVKEKYEKLSSFMNRAICVHSTEFVRILKEGVENSLVVLVLDNLVNWMASYGSVYQDEINVLIKQVILCL
jgi:hypothetical protein